jgi:hypothetical protein
LRFFAEKAQIDGRHVPRQAARNAVRTNSVSKDSLGLWAWFFNWIKSTAALFHNPQPEMASEPMLLQKNSLIDQLSTVSPATIMANMVC